MLAPRAQKICKRCGKIFSVLPCVLKREGRGIFCSRDCMITRLQKECLTCGKRFWTKPSKLAVSKGKYCSKLCFVKTQPRTPEIRIAKYTTVDKTTGCRLWHGSTRGGYAVLTVNKKSIYVHRLVYKLAYGQIPSDMQICHKCDVRNCVNIDHLFLGTPADNLYDAMRKGRFPSKTYKFQGFKGSDHPRAKLTENQILSIRASNKHGVDLAKQFGVTETTICDIRHRRSWKHI